MEKIKMTTPLVEMDGDETVSYTHLDVSKRQPKGFRRAQVSVFEMPAAVPFKGAVCATLCKPTVQGADVIAHRSHDLSLIHI